MSACVCVCTRTGLITSYTHSRNEKGHFIKKKKKELTVVFFMVEAPQIFLPVGLSQFKMF